MRGPSHADAAPSYAAAGKSLTFSLSCTNAGAATVANVTVIVSSTIVGHLAPLGCGDQSPLETNFKSWEYQITLTNQAGTTTNNCASLKPKHGSGSVTCAGGQSSAMLTAQ